jgi:hypothetical protein
VAPDQLPFIYSAALLSDSADRVASYLIRYGKAGSEDLRLALSDGQGAVNLLLQREVPVNRSPGPAMGAAAALVLEHPRLMLAAKYAGYILGLFLLLRGLDLWIVSPAGGPPGAAAARARRRARRRPVGPPRRRDRALPPQGRARVGVPRAP